MHWNNWHAKCEPLPNTLKKLHVTAVRKSKYIINGETQWTCHADVGTLHDEAGKEAFRCGFYTLAHYHFNEADYHYEQQ